MKKLLPFLVLVAAFLASTPLHARVSTSATLRSECSSISHRDVNRLLKIAAKEWSMSVGAAHQAYNAGTLTLTPYPQAGANVYMVAYDGFCILAVLEDKL
jgi:GTP cyclohydrolase III